MFCVTVKKVAGCLYCTIVPFHVPVYLLLLASGYPVAVMSLLSRNLQNLSHAAGVKMEPVKVGKVIHSAKGKDLLVIKGFQIPFPKHSCWQYGTMVLY
jgi:hypothetical protein